MINNLQTSIAENKRVVRWRFGRHLGARGVFGLRVDSTSAPILQHALALKFLLMREIDWQF